METTGNKTEFLEALKSATTVKISCIPKPYCMLIPAKKSDLERIIDNEVELLKWELVKRTLFIYHK